MSRANPLPGRDLLVSEFDQQLACPGIRLRKRFEDEVEAPRAKGREQIAAARFDVLGTDTYPDATFTLRVTYGAVDACKLLKQG